jgi:hypothetical protein
VSLYVFLGPSLPLDEARRVCPAVYLPPVRLGDVRRCVEFGGASGIGIIDGYFERVPAVWHKEILWALANGVRVAGAASMGALRAAELAPFGMQGVGRIFEAYCRGVFAPFDGEPFEDDDEVAVVHGPAEAGWLATEAMVNIRATLAAATDEGVVNAAQRDRLARRAKVIFYKERSWATLLRLAEADGMDVAALARLRTWLPRGRVDQKRRDALELLHRLNELRGRPSAARFAFAATSLWRRAMEPAGDDTDAAVLLELRLTGDEWRNRRDQAWAAIAGDAAADRFDPVPDAAAESDPAAALAALAARADREERTRQRVARAAPLLDSAILARLRADGRYAALQARALAKRRSATVAQEGGEGEPEADACVAWFAARLGEGVSADPEALAVALDFADSADLLRALSCEWRFVHAQGV